MALDSGDNGTDWSAYGACETCGSVAGWPCHRGKRQLKNAHQGRPTTGGDPWGPAPAYDGPPLGPARYSPIAAEAGGSGFERPTTKEPEVANDQAAEAAEWTARLDNAERQPQNPTGKRRADAEIPKDIPRDQYDRPKLVRAERGPLGDWRVPRYPDGPEPHAGKPIAELEGFTRASSLGNALEDSTGLNRWRSGMVVFGMSRRKDLVLAAKAIPGTEDKKLHRAPLYRIADQAQEAAESSSAATVGTALHALTEQVDAGTLAVDIGEYQPVLDVYSERMAGWRVVRSETFVVSDHFHAAGTFDRLITPLEPMALVDQQTGEIIAVIMPGDLVVVDLKTSTTADYFGAKFFAQLAVYVTGQLYDRDPDSPTYGQRTPLGQRTDFALILHIPQGGDADGEPEATWHWLDMRAGLALAQLACVNLETRKKRFTRSHMRPVLAVPAPERDAAVERYSGRRAVDGLVRQPSELPERDPLGDRHLAATAGFIAETQDFPDADADAVDAQLAEDGREPEMRTPAPAALEPSNLGVLAERPDPGGPHKGDDYDAERAAHAEALDHSDDPDNHVDAGPPEPEEETMPGPDETAPLPDGWESAAEQDADAESRMAVPKVDPARLGPSLQDAARRNAQEAAMIRRVERAGSVAELVELHGKATEHGLWTDRVKAAASARKAALKSATTS
jgi:hypothetical protein